MRVYAIRTGEYSDTSWGPVFSTIEKAIEYRDRYAEDRKYRGCEIEVHSIDEEKDDKEYPNYLIVFDKDGNVISHTVEGHAFYDPLLERISVQVPPKDNRWYFLDGAGVRDRATLVIRSVCAPNLQRAIKIASDKRAQFLGTPAP